jgi:hypothetical protein
MFDQPENKSVMKDAPLNTLLEFPAGIEARGRRREFAWFCRKMAAPLGSEASRVAAQVVFRNAASIPRASAFRAARHYSLDRSLAKMIDNV